MCLLGEVDGQFGLHGRNQLSELVLSLLQALCKFVRVYRCLNEAGLEEAAHLFIAFFGEGGELGLETFDDCVHDFGNSGVHVDKY